KEDYFTANTNYWTAAIHQHYGIQESYVGWLMLLSSKNQQRISIHSLYYYTNIPFLKACRFLLSKFLISLMKITLMMDWRQHCSYFFAWSRTRTPKRLIEFMQFAQ